FAILTGILPFEFDRLLGAGCDFLQRQLHLRFQIESALRLDRGVTSATPATPACAKCAAENVVEHRKDVGDVHVRKVMMPAHAGMAELIVTPALVGIGKHLVRFGALLEL